MDAPEAEAMLAALDEGTVDAEVLKQANEMATAFYWSKDADGCHAMLVRARDAARRAMDDAGKPPAKEIAVQYKCLLYNLASFGWLGWDEPGIEIPERLRKDAIEAAETHHAVAEAMDLNPLQRARAAWILAALSIQAGKVDEASELFKQSERLAEEAGHPGEAMNARAFALVCEALRGNAEAESRLKDFEAEMAKAEKAAPYVGQASTALRVFRAAPMKRT